MGISYFFHYNDNWNWLANFIINITVFMIVSVIMPVILVIDLYHLMKDELWNRRSDE